MLFFDDVFVVILLFDVYVVFGFDVVECVFIDVVCVKFVYWCMVFVMYFDKNDGDLCVFKCVVMVYKIFGDVEWCVVYDVSGGVEGEDVCDVLEMEIDISEVGFANTFVASVISLLGVNIKMVVLVKVLEVVWWGEMIGGVVDVMMGCKLSESVRKGEIWLFRCAFSEEDVRRGVVVSVMLLSGDKFKFLKFDCVLNGDGGLEFLL